MARSNCIEKFRKALLPLQLEGETFINVFVHFRRIINHGFVKYVIKKHLQKKWVQRILSYFLKKTKKHLNCHKFLKAVNEV